jgi:hypothetical protein
MLSLHTASKRRWTKSEDERLCSFVSEALSIDEVDWAAATAHVPGRSAKQARERYLNVLDPRISHEPWTEVRGGWFGGRGSARGARSVG